MNVTFRHFGAHLASSRYRSIIPAQQLQAHGVTEGNDWLVIGKHGWNWHEQTAGFNRVCFDICDDHFDGPHGRHYLHGCKSARLITCNSAEMARVIFEKTGREAVVIPDPYEQPEKEPRLHDRVLWFGHQSNLSDLMPWIEGIDNLEVVTGPQVPGTTPWTPENMDRAFDRAGLVIIPTGKSMAKSGNRAIESIRRGLFVVAGYLPAYADLGVYIGNIHDGIRWALDHPEEALARVKASQAYVAKEYSPERIGLQWLKALSV
jgi:hypothetical protein